MFLIGLYRYRIYVNRKSNLGNFDTLALFFMRDN